MTVASEITKLQTNLANSYTAVDNKGGTIPASQNFDNLPTAINSITELKGETKTINPSTSTQTITPSAGKNGITSATVNPVTSAIDANIQAGNIKKDVEILGVTGTFEGGITPTGTVYITSNGSTDVTNYATANVNVPQPAGSLPITTNGTVDVTNYASAVVNVPTNTPTGTISISNNGTYNVSSYENATVNVSGGSATLYNCPIDGYIADASSYNGTIGVGGTCNNDIVFTGVKRVNNTRVLANTFYRQQGSSRTISFPDLENFSSCSYGFERFVSESNGISSISFPKLKTITSGNDYLFSRFGEGSPAIKVVYFPELQTVLSNYVFSNWFSFGRPDEIKFLKLKTISGSGVFEQGFYYLTSSNFHLYFYALDENSFGSNTNQFNDMFKSISSSASATVHFPPKLRLTIGSWGSVTGGYGGGARVTTLFDLGGTLNFNTTPNTSVAYVYGEEAENNTAMVNVGNTEYVIKDDASSTILVDEATGIVLDEVRQINSNLTTGYNTVTLATGAAGLSTTISYGGATIDCYDNSGDYEFKEITPSGTELEYFIVGGDNYMDETGSITTTGSDVTQIVTLTPATISTFVRPDLTANGTLGGDSFAVTSSSQYSAIYAAYRAVDDNATNTQWRSATSDSSPKYTFYNPNLLKLNSLTFTWGNATYRATNVVVEASNDNTNWTSLGSYSLSNATSVTATIGDTSFYKYFRLSFTRNSTYINLRNIGINAGVKIPSS